MFRPQIQKSRILVFMALITMLSVFWVSNSMEYIPTDDINEKKEATRIMSSYLKSIKNKVKSIENPNDIYESGLIGLDSSAVTSLFDNKQNSFLNSKIACTHPNFAALIVNMFNEAELSRGDTIAVSMTGSLPGANIALFAACEAFDITPVVISSVASSAWGANRENFTWLDIESLLFNENLISSDFISKASSIGGGGDIGENLTDAGIEIIEEKILSNDIDRFINQNSTKKNINKKMSLYNDFKIIEDYSAFVNIGGNVSSIGTGIGKDTMKVGVIFPIEINDILDENSEFEETLAYKFLDSDVVFINIKNIKDLSQSWNLYPPDRSIKRNEGTLFYSQEPYTITSILISLFVNIAIVSWVGIKSHNQIKRRMKNEESEIL